MCNGYQLQFSINRVFNVEKFVAEPFVDTGMKVRSIWGSISTQIEFIK